MDYYNSPQVWSSCSVRFFEQHYEAESWFQCMSDVTYCPGISDIPLVLLSLYSDIIEITVLEVLITFQTNIEQCCDTIDVTSTNNAGHPGLGTYTRVSYNNDGRAVYFNGWGYLYWLSLYDVWGVSKKRTIPKLYFV